MLNQKLLIEALLACLVVPAGNKVGGCCLGKSMLFLFCGLGSSSGMSDLVQTVKGKSIGVTVMDVKGKPFNKLG